MRRTLALALALTALLLCACRPPAADESRVSSTSVSSQSGSNTGVASSSQTSSNTGEQPVQPATDSGQYYTLNHSPDYESLTLYVMNAAGDMRAEHDLSYNTVYDPDSHLPLYQIVWEYEATGGYNEWNDPAADMTTLVRDMAGRTLFEEGDSDLSGGVAEWMIRYPEDGPPALYNVKTGESRFENVGGIMPFEGGYLLCESQEGSPVALVDRGMNTVRDLSGSPAWKIQSPWRGYLLAYSEDYDWPANSETYLLSSSLEPLYVFKNMTAYGDIGGGDWLLCEDDEGAFSFLDAATGLRYDAETDQPYSNPSSFMYGDSERLIRRRDGNYYLCDSAEQPLTTAYSYLVPVGGDLRAPSALFCGARAGQLEIIDRSGAVLVSRPWGSVGDWGITQMSADLIRVNFDDTVALLDMQLRDIIPTGTYRSLYRPDLPVSGNYYYYDEATAARADFVSAWKTVGNVDVQDLYDLKGNLIISNVRTLGDFGPDAIMILRGSTVGLIDYHGNWLNKASVFDSYTGD